jgi:hypothetical protein
MYTAMLAISESRLSTDDVSEYVSENTMYVFSDVHNDILMNVLT